ncbi:hypothetical protein [Candidatus Protochlamydia phocaeensis]|uniref:hypothetical protein n=1 Tax=Candidatus Protochlamydia phocaeensis TaxID=1414722 RepID=UPI000839A0E5|nr:hypothetical protein [Candidatus Protochlamydia phocaeensis]
MKTKVFSLLVLFFVFSSNIVFSEQDRTAINSYTDSLTFLAKQRLATEFTLDAALAIDYCKEADELFVKSLMAFLDSEKSEQDCLFDFYKAQEKLIDAKQIVEKWEKKSQISKITEEISILKQGISDITYGCEVWTKIVENICKGNTEEDDVSFKGSQASTKVQVGRERLMKFSVNWAFSIYCSKSKPRSNYIQLTKAQYASIKRHISNIFTNELKAFKESKDRNELSTYVWCARMFDYVVTEELERDIEEEDIENTRDIEEPESNEVIEQDGETWIISKFRTKKGHIVFIRTRFQKSDQSYDKQSIFIPGKYECYQESLKPKIVILPEGEKLFAFSYDEYGTFLCIISLDEKKVQHQCKLLISKE